jgi:hypothetical protein
MRWQLVVGEVRFIWSRQEPCTTWYIWPTKIGTHISGTNWLIPFFFANHQLANTCEPRWSDSSTKKGSIINRKKWFYVHLNRKGVKCGYIAFGNGGIVSLTVSDMFLRIKVSNVSPLAYLALPNNHWRKICIGLVHLKVAHINWELQLHSNLI